MEDLIYLSECYNTPINKFRCIYLIQDMNNGFLKIGISKNPKKRLKQLQDSNPNYLKLISVIKNKPFGYEKDLHNLFDDLRFNKEWFKKSNSIINYFNKYGDKP